MLYLRYLNHLFLPLTDRKTLPILVNHTSPVNGTEQTSDRRVSQIKHIIDQTPKGGKEYLFQSKLTLTEAFVKYPEHSPLDSIYGPLRGVHNVLVRLAEHSRF